MWQPKSEVNFVHIATVVRVPNSLDCHRWPWQVWQVYFLCWIVPKLAPSGLPSELDNHSYTWTPSALYTDQRIVNCLPCGPFLTPLPSHKAGWPQQGCSSEWCTPWHCTALHCLVLMHCSIRHCTALISIGGRRKSTISILSFKACSYWSLKPNFENILSFSDLRSL